VPTLARRPGAAVGAGPRGAGDWGPDAFVFTPVHPSTRECGGGAIRRAGIPIFGFVNRMHPGLCVSYVGSSDERLAGDIAEHLFAHLQWPRAHRHRRRSG
jgi:ABC-type sugar transport system substrate-binding protein